MAAAHFAMILLLSFLFTPVFSAEAQILVETPFAADKDPADVSVYFQCAEVKSLGVFTSSDVAKKMELKALRAEACSNRAQAVDFIKPSYQGLSKTEAPVAMGALEAETIIDTAAGPMPVAQLAVGNHVVSPDGNGVHLFNRIKAINKFKVDMLFQVLVEDSGGRVFTVYMTASQRLYSMSNAKFVATFDLNTQTSIEGHNVLIARQPVVGARGRGPISGVVREVTLQLYPKGRDVYQLLLDQPARAYFYAGGVLAR